LIHPDFAATHQIAINRHGPAANSTARRNQYVFSFESAVRMPVPELPGGANIALRFRSPHVDEIKSKQHAELCRELWILTSRNAINV
jgi:hypothetical protein